MDLVTSRSAPSDLNRIKTNKTNRNRLRMPPVIPEEIGFSYSVETFGFFFTAGGFLDADFLPEDFAEELAAEDFFLLS